jgi:L-amino acid N-acyltransferase YncA
MAKPSGRMSSALITIRSAQAADGEAVAAIYGEGIAGRGATFRTDPPTASEMAGPIERGDEYPLLVAERGDRVVGWAGVKPYSDFPPYRPVVECMLYVTKGERRKGIGLRLLEALAEECSRVGLTKLIGKIFTDNEASIALCARCDFRVVGVHRRHGRLEGEWKDVVVVERLLGDALR